ncbi:MAG: DUF5134 domain-containing protein [Pseudonocardiaceae bacterium]
MGGAEWVRWVFAGMFAALTVFSVIRLLAGRPDASASGGGDDRTVDVSRGVMSLGMVAMLVPSWDPLPRLGWQLVFGLAAGHIALRAIRRRARAAPASVRELGANHELHLVVGGLAMVYMFAVMPAGQQMMHGMDMTPMGSTGLTLPALTWALVAYFLVFVVRLGTRLALPVNTLPLNVPAGGMVVSPHLLGSSEVVMGIGMSYMLMTML